MLRTILKICLLVVALTNSAFANELNIELARPGHPGHPGGPNQPTPPNYPPQPPYGRDFVYRNLNQYFSGRNTLRLRQILNIGPEYRGRRVEFVVLRARSNRNRAYANLVINQRPVGYTQELDYNTREYRFMPDRYNDIIDDQIRSLQLDLDGEAIVDGVGVQFADDGYNPSPWEETLVIQQNFRGNVGIQIARYVDLARHYGQSLRGVSLRASTARGMGRASFCASRGCSPDQQVGTGLREYYFPTYGEVVDRNSYNWTMNLQGDFWVDTIVLYFNR